MELAAVLDSMVDSVFVCDATGKLIAINRAGLRFIGARDLAEAIGKAGHPFRLPNVRQANGQPIPPECTPLARALRGEEIVLEIEFVEDTRGNTVLRTRSAPIRDPAGAIIGAVKTATDVTREYELERLKEDFIRVAAHELKTPVTVIKASAQATLDSLPDAAPVVRQLLESVNRGADRIDRLVSSLLDLVELQGGLLSITRLPVELDRLVDDVLRGLSRGAAARVRLTASAPIRIAGDQHRLRRAIRSLVDNALKYSAPESQVEVSLTRADGVARLSIADHGIGIPADKAGRVFEKFFRAHAGTPQDAGGIGVGLFIAREIMAQHDGRIWFDTVPNEGTVFHVELPVTRGERK